MGILSNYTKVNTVRGRRYNKNKVVLRFENTLTNSRSQKKQRKNHNSNTKQGINTRAPNFLLAAAI
jgi:hypothetical protein